jgi:hypothetical protein
VILIDEADCDNCETQANELSRFELVNLEAGAPDNVPALKALLGEWDFRIPISETPSHRLVYERPICYGDRLLAGVYFNVTEDKVFAVKGVVDSETFDKMRSEGAEFR